MASLFGAMVDPHSVWSSSPPLAAPEPHPHHLQQQQQGQAAFTAAMMYGSQTHQQQQHQLPQMSIPFATMAPPPQQYTAPAMAMPSMALSLVQLPDGQIVYAYVPTTTQPAGVGTASPPAPGAYFAAAAAMPTSMGGGGFAAIPAGLYPAAVAGYPQQPQQQPSIMVQPSHQQQPSSHQQAQSHLLPPRNTAPRATSVSGAPSSIEAPSVEPLKALVQQCSVGLVQRDVTTVATAITPIPADRLRELIALTYASFATDRDLMVFVKERFPVELCLQIRDLLVTEYNERANANGSGGKAPAMDSLLAVDLVERRGALTVSLIEVMTTLPSPCSHEEQFRGATDPQIQLTSFCPFARIIFHSLFETLAASPRGCVALLRFFASVASAPRPVDNMVRKVTERLGTFVFDPHANYLVSHVLCACRPSATVDRVFDPIPRAEMLSRTPLVLSLATDKKALPLTTATGAPMPARRVAMASPKVWGVFVEELTKVLTADVVRVAVHREGSHILEYALRNIDFGAHPEACAILEAVGSDFETTLRPLLASPCGRHCIVSLADAIALRAPNDPLTEKIVGQLALVKAYGRHSTANPAQYSAVEAAINRIPRFRSMAP